MRPSRHEGFTLIELLIVVAIIGIIAAVSVPGLLRARISGNEASAIGSMRAIASAQADYNALNRAYADDLTKLAATCAQVTSPFVAADLSNNGVWKSGYAFVIAAGTGSSAGPNDICGATTVTGFYATGSPITSGLTGNRGFATNTLMAIWQNTGASAPPTEAQMAAAPTTTVAPLGRPY